MNLIPFFESSMIIQIHVYATLLALATGAYVLATRKGGSIHKLLGRIFVGTMAFAALSSFFIHEIKLLGPFSPIHILSVVVLISLFRAVSAIRNGDVVQHKSIMKALFFGGLIIPGLLTLMPGRLLHNVLLGPILSDHFAAVKSPFDDFSAVFVIAILLAGLAYWIFVRRLR